MLNNIVKDSYHNLLETWSFMNYSSFFVSRWKQIDAINLSAFMISWNLSSLDLKHLLSVFHPIYWIPVTLKLYQHCYANSAVFWLTNQKFHLYRWAMFGFAVGLLTEYATGSDFVDQIKILLSNFGIVDLEWIPQYKNTVNTFLFMFLV